jgi:predicted Zn-dependent peptidase
MAELPPLHRGEIDGIRALWSPCPGPMAGGIAFRVGRADESIPYGGITHLVEHLAMTAAQDGPYDDCNAFVDATVTAFAARGEPADVAAFVNHVAATLSDLPLDQVGTHRRVLRVEGAGENGGLRGQLLAARYGLRGFGAAGGRELGLGWLGPEEVAAYAARYFTAGNAVLWFTGQPPAGLSPVLPAGQRRPLPPASQRPLRLPACLHDGDEDDDEGGAALSLLAPWAPATGVGLSILDRRAFKLLRGDLGASYHAGVDVADDVDPGTVHAMVTADALPTDVPKVRDGLLAVVNELAATGPTQGELDRSTRDYQRRYANQPELDGWVCGQAANELYGRPFEQPAERIAMLRALTPGDVAAVFERARATAIMALPGYCSPPDGFTLLERDGGEPVQGRVHRFAFPFSRRRLVAGEEGLTLSDKDGRATVRFDDCIAVLTWRDGARILLGHDGVSILFAQEAFRGGATVAQLIWRRVPHDRWVPMDELEPSPFAD